MKYQKAYEEVLWASICIHTILTDPGLSPEDSHPLPKIRPSRHKMDQRARRLSHPVMPSFPLSLAYQYYIARQRSTLGA